MGLDTHDPCDRTVYEPGMVITCEPGLYVRAQVHQQQVPVLGNAVVIGVVEHHRVFAGGGDGLEAVAQAASGLKVSNIQYMQDFERYTAMYLSNNLMDVAMVSKPWRRPLRAT